MKSSAIVRGRTVPAESSARRTRRRWASAVAVYDDERPWFEVEVTQGKWTKVDVANMDLVVGQCWHLSTNGYALSRHGRKLKRMHRVVLGLGDDRRDTDHINGDKLDNRRANLRVATRSENLANQRKTRGLSRFKGVSWHKAAKKWVVYITIDGTRHHLGLFTDEEDGARAYNEAAREAWGPFARLNDVPALGTVAS